MGLMGRGNVDIMQMLSKAQDEYDKVRCLYVSLIKNRKGGGTQGNRGGDDFSCFISAGEKIKAPALSKFHE